MNRTAKDIYEDYRHQLLKIRVILRDAPEQFSDQESFESLAMTMEKLEALIDLYAYLLANRT